MVYTQSVKTARMQAVAGAIGAGAKLEIGTANMAVVLATIPLDGATVSGSVLTLGGLPASAVAAASGTPAAARIRTSADVDVVTGLSVGTSTKDIILDSANITAGQTVNITSGTITHAA